MFTGDKEYYQIVTILAAKTEDSNCLYTIATGQSRWSSWFDTALELCKGRGFESHPSNIYACDFAHRTWERTEFTMPHIGVLWITPK